MSYSKPNLAKQNQIYSKANQWITSKLHGFSFEGIETMNGKSYAIAKRLNNSSNACDIRHIDSQVFMTL
jgi:hypothetical protein